MLRRDPPEFDIIERIYVAPDAPEWFSDLVQQVVNRYEHNVLPVVKSSLATSSAMSPIDER